MMREAILPSWVALVEIVRKLEEQPYHWPVQRSIFHAIAYVATRHGLPTGFTYRRGSFGPFSGDQAEVIATVMFAADALKQEKRSSPTETEVLDAVLQWKQKRRPPLDEMAVASTIRNLGMLRWLEVKPDVRLRLPEEESILV